MRSGAVGINLTAASHVFIMVRHAGTGGGRGARGAVKGKECGDSGGGAVEGWNMGGRGLEGVANLTAASHVFIMVRHGGHMGGGRSEGRSCA